jgi:site-specific DNA recombinase
MKTAAIYARVSSDKQKEENTIASQTAALTAFATEQGYAVPTEWIFEDEGYSGASLIRPGLERVRDLAAEGELDAVLVYAPDRLSRRYAYQILLIEELARAGVETLFIRSPRATTAEDQLLLQFQGMIAEYERAQILERSRRGKRHRAQQGQVSVPQRRAVRLSLYSQERAVGGVLRGQRGGGAGRSMGVRALYH